MHPGAEHRHDDGSNECVQTMECEGSDHDRVRTQSPPISGLAFGPLVYLGMLRRVQKPRGSHRWKGQGWSMADTNAAGGEPGAAVKTSLATVCRVVKALTSCCSLPPW
jgi:hypothetical protein